MTKEIAVKENTELSTDVLDFSADASQGLENVDKDSLAIPFLQVLQPLSPQIENVEGAKAGKLINTITNELMDEAYVIPVAFQRRFIRWALRENGGGYKGEMTAAEVEALNIQRDDKNRLIYEGDELKDTRNHFVILANKELTKFQPALFSLSSTQIKKSKRWLSLIQGIQMKDANGKIFTPPSFSHIYSIKTVKESNDQGFWYGVDIGIVGPLQSRAVYESAKAFHNQIVSGKVNVQPPAEETVVESDDRF
jgi:hypothetical protein